MAFTWSSALETGHSVIDSQHKELISAVNSLLSACRQGQGVAKVEETLDFLVSYTKRHFGDEEALQVKLPGVTCSKGRHCRSSQLSTLTKHHHPTFDNLTILQTRVTVIMLS